MKGEDDRRGFCGIFFPEKPFTGSGELDFGDVFGGPPRRHFLMRAVREPMAAAAAEEPIFGGKRAGRRQHLLHGDHFFDDIFRGHESWRTHRYRSRYSNDTKGGQDEMMMKYELVNQVFDESCINKERDSRLITDVKKQSQSCRWTTTAGTNQKVKENSRKVEVAEQCPQTKTQSYTSNNTCTNNNKKAAFSSVSLRWDSKILGENLDDPFEDLFELQELCDDLQPRSEVSEETKALDAKIRDWSAGKERNIRSLLSTLQYVLWGGSGWQAIALVDLMEENEVKRGYQKALLRLHPDKLQQKGAASLHKYIAQRVFDILQEAWNHFNNINATL